MGSRSRYCLAAVVLVIGISSLHAQAPVAPAAPRKGYAAAIASARKIIQDTMAVLGTPGAQIAVAKDGRLVWSEGFGFADLEQRVPVTKETRFRLASVSKPLTSVAVGLLVEQGKLDLDVPVQRYVPSFPDKRWPITTREVAGHIAGIRHYRSGEFENMKHYATVVDGLSIFRDDTLLFEPGTKFSYSSYGWNLVSAAVEGASSEPFLDFMQLYVFGPFDMTHTGPEFADSLIPFRAHFYAQEDLNGTLNAPYVDNSYKWAGGGFLSTAEDMVRFGDGLLENRVLKPETLALLWTPMQVSDGSSTEYGIGWGVRQDSAGRRLIRHTGGGMGATAHLVIYPEQHLVAMLFVNSDLTFISALPRIAELFLQ